MLGIYTRLSREDGDSTSIANQIREGKQFAKSKGLQFSLYNEGEGISGALPIEERPELEKLIEDIKNNLCHAVWFRNQNRLGRSMETHIAFITACLKYKTEVYFDNKLFDYTDPTEDLIGNVLSALNTYTAKLQSKQTKRSLLDNVLEGKAHGKSTPLGYKADAKGYIVIDEAEKPIVETIYRMCLEGKGAYYYH